MTKPKARGNGEGSVYFVEAEKRWKASAYIEDINTGERKRRVVTGQTMREAQDRMKALRDATEKGEATTGVPTMAEFLARWLEAERSRVRPSTWTQRSDHVRVYIVPAVGAMKVTRVTPTDVERMCAALIARGLSARTAAHVRVTLRKALGDALRDGLVVRNVAALARPVRVEQTEAAHLDVPQVKALLEVASRDDEVGPLVIVAVTTGLRQGEILALCWDSVDLERGLLTVRRNLARDWEGGFSLSEPKTRRSRRTIRLPAQAQEALRRAQTRSGALREAAGQDWQDVDGLVFTDSLGRHMERGTVRRKYQRLLTQAKLPVVPFHALRHSAATAAIGAGVPLHQVADMLGHSGVAVTAAVYRHAVVGEADEVAVAMDRVLA